MELHDPHLEETENTTPDRLDELRAEMTAATEQFVAALNRRGELALQIAEEKKRRGVTQIRDLNREQMVLDHAERVSTGPFPASTIRQVVQLAMDASSELQATTSGISIGEPASAQDTRYPV